MQQVRTLVVMLAVAGWVGIAGAQEASSLDASEATDYIGEWALSMETPRGTREQTLSITDVGGKLAATLSGGRGGALDITDITKSDAGLVLAFERNMRGNSAPVVLTLSLDGDTLNATQDVNNGRFSMSGTGKKQ